MQSELDDAATRRIGDAVRALEGRSAAGRRARRHTRLPDCGGALEEGQTAICAYCGGKITAGEFPWVLSRIEQDEAYRG